MKERKSFLLHFDSLSILEKLSDEQAGKLFKAIADYHKGEDLDLDPLIDIAFTPFKNQFIRDGEKYKKLCEKNRLIAEKRYSRSATKSTTGNDSIPEATKSTDNDSKSDSDSDSKSDNKNIINTLVEVKPQRGKFKYSDRQFRFAEAMLAKIKDIAPSTKKPNLESWANSIRLLNETDSVDLDQAWKVFCWANRDSFWKTNILSASKFRDKYPQLSAKAFNNQNESVFKIETQKYQGGEL
jgi:hypothetical protein